MGHIGIVTERFEGVPVRVLQLGKIPRPAHVIEDNGETVKVRFYTSGRTCVVARTRLIFEQQQNVTKLERPPKLTKFGEMTPVPKDRPQRDAIYLAHIRSRACCICSTPSPSDPHHFGPGGMGLKADDRRTIPLCRSCHDLWHLNGTIKPYTRVEIERDFYRAQVDALISYDRRE